MIIRNYIPTDCRHLAELFYQTVHTINAKDYTLEQLDVWADGHVDLEVWNHDFLAAFTVYCNLPSGLLLKAYYTINTTIFEPLKTVEFPEKFSLSRLP